MTLPEKWRALSRAWSVQLAAVGAAAYALILAIDTGALQAAWAGAPEELRAIVPDEIVRWFTFLLFVAIPIVRSIPQSGVGTLPAPAFARPLGLIAEPAWKQAVRAACARTITSIAVHCAATPEGRAVTAATVRTWHKGQGWSDIGYHFFIRLDGTIEIGRPIGTAGAHVVGHNAKSVGICYAGGVAADAKTPKDTRTPAQKAAMLELLKALKARFPKAEIKGHRDYPNVAKACPSFDAKREYAGL